MSEFTLYPAIDVLGGACVRLHQGDYAAKTEYSASPSEMVQQFVAQGARFIHMVDLDGAKAGSPINVIPIAAAVRMACDAGAAVQVGGGIRTYDDMARWMDVGVTRCVIGTAALDEAWMEGALARFGMDAILVGLDGRGGKMAVRGWLEQTDVSLVDVAKRLYAQGVRHALVTDVDRDGTMQGANLTLAKQIQDTGIEAIASGGIRNVDDVLAAKRAGLSGAIAGRSVYDGTLNVREALVALEA